MSGGRLFPAGTGWAVFALFVVTLAVLGQEEVFLDRSALQAVRATNGILVDGPPLDFTLERLDGTPVSLSSLRGQVVLVNFWATWCPPCREEFPSMIAMARQMEDQPFRMLALTQDEDEAALQAFLQEQQVPLDLVWVLRDPGGEVARRWGTRLLPETWWMDRDGRVALRYQSTRDWTGADFHQIAERMWTGRWRQTRR
jgi:thiol-disulfide isomerase/thioredoxin